MAKERTSADEPGVDYGEFEQKSQSHSSQSQSESDRAAFEKVLNETLNHQSSQATIDEAGMAALTLVAQRYPGSKLTLDPIAVELVDSILGIRIDRQGRPASFWHEMSMEIAVSLYESPASKERLVILWDSLLGGFK
jgi:hypothetical protein